MATAPTRQDSVFYTHELPNGLQMLGQLMPDVASTASAFWVMTGTRDEVAGQMGVSHFLEHMAFRRTPNMTGDQIDRTFEELGAQYNAATWLEMTYYWARVLSDRAPAAIGVLAELTHPVLDADDFEQERPVILEEIARYQDLPSHVLFARFLHQYFGDNPLGWETLGTEETIKNLTVEEMRAYWARRYGASNILFAVAGNFDWDSMVAQLQTLTQDWERGETGRATGPVSFRSGLQVLQEERFAQEQIAVGTPSVARGDDAYYVASVLSVIVGDDTGSRLFWKLHETGLAESATMSPLSFEDTGIMLTHISTEPDKAREALAAAREVLAEVQRDGVEAGELERAKAKLLASVVIGGESTNERMMGLIQSWLAHRRLETLEDLRRRIESVSLDDVRAYLRDYPLSPDQLTVAVGPLPEENLAGEE